MKRYALTLIVILGLAGLAAAQVTSPTADVLGAHNVYGRGCIACHAPHSGAAGNGVTTGGGNTGNLALWGQNLSPLYGQTITFGGSNTVTIPNYGTTAVVPIGSPAGTLPIPAVGLPASADDGTFIITACLSCHDGNVAVVGMMKGTTVETVTINSFSFNPPTLLGNDGSTPGNYLNDHPVGPTVHPGCGGPYNWDCTVNTTTGAITFTGPNSTQFKTDYYDVTSGNGPLANLVGTGGSAAGFGGSTSTTLWVTCTTCHDQHDMLYFNTAASGPIAIKPTHFFVRGWYNPGNTTTSNSAAQFCRSCHGGESNEMHGQIVPTT
jgi:hypothetical protein